jgi:adhesin/invasin
VSGDAGQIVLQTGPGGPTFGAVSPIAAGVYTATVTSSTTPGKFTLTAIDNGVSGAAHLTQLGPPARVTVGVSPSTIAADGTSTTNLTVHVRDAAGDPVSGDAGQIVLQTGTGGPTFGAVSQTAAGVYTATVTSSTTPGTFTLTATDNSVTPPASGATRLTQT